MKNGCTSTGIHILVKAVLMSTPGCTDSWAPYTQRRKTCRREHVIRRYCNGIMMCALYIIVCYKLLINISYSYFYYYFIKIKKPQATVSYSFLFKPLLSTQNSFLRSQQSVYMFMSLSHVCNMCVIPKIGRMYFPLLHQYSLQPFPSKMSQNHQRGKRQRNTNLMFIKHQFYLTRLWRVQKRRTL